MARPRKPRPRKPQPEDPKARELGGSAEERNRHLRYAHEQYSGSGQGHFGTRKGHKLPLQKPRAGQADYPPGTRMPWPPDEAVDDKHRRRRRKPADCS